MYEFHSMLNGVLLRDSRAVLNQRNTGKAKNEMIALVRACLELPI
jgi:hypothetical protein